MEIENGKFYKIVNYNQMPDFFMTIVSDSDHWMFISSNGSHSAGRKDWKQARYFPELVFKRSGEIAQLKVSFRNLVN